MQIAVLLTCYNRRTSTIACLESLAAQHLAQETELTIYLVDDGCTDGTAEAVAQRFPKVRIILGDGNLYWCGGMRAAWHAAIADADYDYYLWLNDDVKLLPEAIAVLVRSWRDVTSAERPGIILGSTCDLDSGRQTYGGYEGHRIVEPSVEMQTCERMTGNIVLVPRTVFKVVGTLSPDFCHAFGDMDYGYRVRTAGFQIWVAPGFLGYCRGNPCPPWADPSVPFLRRWKSLHSPTGYPFVENVIFCKRHNKWLGPIKILKLYFRMFSPGTWHWLKGVTGRTEDGEGSRSRPEWSIKT